jgi:radical SAM superfamily enzyme YgiQ (UPF0313 family)
MAHKGKLKVLLIQLPFPYFGFKKHWGNIPLAAGFMKAMAHREGLLNDADIEILDPGSTNLSSDAALIDIILGKAPDLLGFSVYSWNALRSLFIARAVKDIRPETLVIMGGSEVTLETDYLMEDPVVDIGCVGEGELTFVDILKTRLGGGERYKDIEGIFYREDGRLLTTGPREQIDDLDLIPSPYLLGFLNPADYEEAWLENMRGCPVKCAYCAHGTRPAGYFSEERLREELRLIKRQGVRWVKFVNGTFIASPMFKKTVQMIREVNEDRKLAFFAFINAEDINEEKADLLEACNFQQLEIGLQSAKPATLKEINRGARLEKFLKGMQILNERRFDTKIDVIIGLPNEGAADFKKTLTFLKRHGLDNITPFVLFILPGTRLRKEAGKYGIKYQPLPPYLTEETATFSASEIEEAVTQVKGEAQPVFSGSLIDYCQTEFPSQESEASTRPADWTPSEQNLNKIVLELDASLQRADQLKRLGEDLSRRITQPFTAWFKSRDLGRDFELIRSFIPPVAAPNPYLLWSVVLETDRAFDPALVEKIKQVIAPKEIMFDFCRTSEPITMCALLPWTGAFDKAWLEDIRREVPLYRSLTLSENMDWRRESESLFRENHGAGCLVDMDRSCSLDFVARMLSYFSVKTRREKKEILYRNQAVYYAMQMFQNQGQQTISIRRPEKLRGILSLDKQLNVVSFVGINSETAMALAAFQMKLKRRIQEAGSPA